MDKQAIVENVTIDVNEKLTQNNLTMPPKFLYEWIVDAILLHNKIVPTDAPIDYNHAMRLGEVLQQWIVDDSGHPLMIDSNVSSQILQHLTQEGWTIIAPQ